MFGHAVRRLCAGTMRTRAYSTRPKVLLMDDILLAKTDLERLSAHADILCNETRSRGELMTAFQPGGRYSGVRGIYRHFGGTRSIKVSGRFDEELVQSLPLSLKFIVHNGAGYDQLDIPCLSKRGIQVANVPSVVNEATADTALFLLIGALRQFPRAMGDLQRGVFHQQFSFAQASDPEGLTLGIVGAGGIGRTLARKAAHALGMHIVYHNRHRLSEELETQGMPEGKKMEYALSLDSLLGQSDVVSLHCPLTPQTKGLISGPQLARMQSHAVLINTARGPIVDEDALVDALDQGVIAGAGLDVYANEPHIHPGLLRLSTSKALLLPHVGTLSLQTQTDMEAVCLRNLEHGLHTGRLLFTVKEQEGLDLHA
ncbi:glyoxylate reductase [Malassezia nana]|uniref:Glyoxylate reductase n=1 Tax=Malassezia nana TaxID=180528 RepID=A0AAF0J2M8_9BASI|nr:glyoxylate reductase [Malassezia nana]